MFLDNHFHIHLHICNYFWHRYGCIKLLSHNEKLKINHISVLNNHFENVVIKNRKEDILQKLRILHDFAKSGFISKLKIAPIIFSVPTVPVINIF